MSKRRKSGEWVWLLPNSGFVGESDRLKVEIPLFCSPDPCLLECGDPECLEYTEVWTEPDPICQMQRHCLCHVSECQMLDEKWEKK